MGAKHDFMQDLAFVDNAQAQSFISAHAEVVRAKAHIVCHLDSDGALSGLCITCNAPGFLLFGDRACGCGMGRISMGKSAASAYQ